MSHDMDRNGFNEFHDNSQEMASAPSRPLEKISLRGNEVTDLPIQQELTNDVYRQKIMQNYSIGPKFERFVKDRPLTAQPRSDQSVYMAKVYLTLFAQTLVTIFYLYTYTQLINQESGVTPRATTTTSSLVQHAHAAASHAAEKVAEPVTFTVQDPYSYSFQFFEKFWYYTSKALNL